ncbi:MAG: hypothetical protein ABIO19_12275 [Burkholderiaceae bacterium]
MRKAAAGNCGLTIKPKFIPPEQLVAAQEYLGYSRKHANFRAQTKRQLKIQQPVHFAGNSIGWRLDKPASHPKILLMPQHPVSGLRANTGFPIKSAALLHCDTLAAQFTLRISQEKGFIWSRTSSPP